MTQGHFREGRGNPLKNTTGEYKVHFKGLLQCNRKDARYYSDDPALTTCAYCLASDQYKFRVRDYDSSRPIVTVIE